MPYYPIKVTFEKLVKKWNKLTKIGFFFTQSPTSRIGKKTIITLIFFNIKHRQRAKKILGKNPCK